MTNNFNPNILKNLKEKNKDELLNSLSDKDKEKLSAVLNDKQELEKILKSPEAIAIMKMLGGGKNG